MESPKVSNKVTFTLQAGPARVSVTVKVGDLNLENLKDFACNFINRKFPEHNLTRLKERVTLFRHDYTSTNFLLPINTASEIAEGTVVEVVVSGEDPSEYVEIKRHTLKAKTFKYPTFCDFCGEMIFGMIRQGLNCKGCGLNFHKRCANKIPNDCTHTWGSPTSLDSGTPAEPLRQTKGSADGLDDSVLGDSFPSCAHSPFLHMGRPAWVEREFTGRSLVAHTFVAQTYYRPTVCLQCKKLLKGISRQGLQCKDCKFNVHKNCQERVPMDCIGDASEEWSERVRRSPASGRHCLC